jgi:hypothetical protein
MSSQEIFANDVHQNFDFSWSLFEIEALSVDIVIVEPSTYRRVNKASTLSLSYAASSALSQGTQKTKYSK